MIEKIQNNDLHKALESAYAVVDFSAVWCGPCQMLAPVLEEVAAQMPDVAFFQVDTDENMELAVQYGIPHVAEMAIDPDLAKAVDEGRIEELAENPLEKFAKEIL